MNALSSADISMFSEYYGTFLFVLLRSSIFVSMMPVFGDKQLPAQFKIGMAVFISIMLTPTVKFEINESQIAFLVIREIIFGIALGLAVRFVFMAVNIAGAFISHSMGLSMAQAFNPNFGQSTQVSEIYGIITMLLFLATDAHHDLIYVFVKSFEVLPGGEINITGVISKIIEMGGQMFVVALKIAAPVMTGLAIANLLSGFLYKAAPQLNIFFIAMPLNLFLGFLLMIMSIPVFEYVLNINISNMREDLVRIVAIAKG